jgi:hypothetical protein
MGLVGKLVKGFLALLLVLVILGVSVSLLAPEGPERGPAATETASPQTGAPATVTGPSGLEPEKGLPAFEEPFFTLATEGGVVGLAVPQGGSFTIPVVVEGHNGFSSSVSLRALIAVDHDSDGNLDYVLGPAPDLYTARVHPDRVAPGGVGEVVVEISSGFQPGRYLLLVTGSADGFSNTIVIPFSVYRFPSYMIVPRVEEPLVRPLDEVKIWFDVIPVGPFNGTVELSISASEYVEVVDFSNNAGTPPFTATATIVVRALATQCYAVNNTEEPEETIRCDAYSVDPWANFSLNPQPLESASSELSFLPSLGSNMNVFVIAKGSPGGSSAVVLFGMESPPRERGLFDLVATLASVLTAPFSVAFGVLVGVAAGVATGAALIPTGFHAVVAAGEVFAATASMFLPEAIARDVVSVDGIKGTVVNRAGYFDSFLRVGILGGPREGSILLPSSSLSSAPLIPFVAYSERSGASLEAYAVVLKSRFLFAEEYTRIGPLDVEVIDRGEGYMVGYINASALTGRPLDKGKIYLRLVDEAGRTIEIVEARLPPSRPLAEALLALRPGETGVLALSLEGRPVNPGEIIRVGYSGNYVSRFSVNETSYNGVPAYRFYSSASYPLNATLEPVEAGLARGSLLVAGLPVRGGSEPGLYKAMLEVVTRSGERFFVRVLVVVEVSQPGT